MRLQSLAREPFVLVVLFNSLVKIQKNNEKNYIWRRIALLLSLDSLVYLLSGRWKRWTNPLKCSPHFFVSLIQLLFVVDVMCACMAHKTQKNWPTPGSEQWVKRETVAENSNSLPKATLSIWKDVGAKDESSPHYRLKSVASKDLEHMKKRQKKANKRMKWNKKFWRQKQIFHNAVSCSET